MPLAECAYKNSVTSAHWMMPFYTMYGYHPCAGTALTETKTLSMSSLAYGHWMLAVFEDCKNEVEKSRELMKKYVDQHRLEPPTFEPGKLVILNGKKIKTRCPAHKLKYKMYGSYDLLDIISLTAVRLHLPKTSKIYMVFHVSHIDPFIKGDRDVDLNAILQTSDPIENAPEYDVDKVMGSTEQDGKVLYLEKWKGWPAKKHWTREPFDSL
jgi:hypothetical protein